MTRNELMKLFAKNAIILIRNGANHDMFYSPITGKKFPVARHTKDIPIGTLNLILKDSGLK